MAERNQLGAQQNTEYIRHEPFGAATGKACSASAFSSMGNKMLKELATVAAYGASASFGRGVYKSNKNENPLLWLLISIAMTVYGFKLIAEGGEEGYGVAKFFTLLGAVMLIMFGAALFAFASLMIMLYTGLYDHYAGGNLDRAFPYIVAVSGIYLVIAGLIGSAWGGSEKAKRLRINAIEDHNMQFLDANGFQDSGLGDDIIEDAEGNRLKLKEEQEGRMVFSVVGRRNVRAVIMLDDEGWMIEYTGAVRL